MSAVGKIAIAVGVFAILPQVLATGLRLLPYGLSDIGIEVVGFVLIMLPVIGFGLAIWAFERWRRAWSIRMQQKGGLL